MKHPLERILLIRTDRIGDVILTTPAASILREHFPGLHVTFLARSYTRPLLQHHRHIDDIMVYEPEDRHRGWRGHLKLIAELRAGKFDAAILFYPRPALAAALRLANIPLRIGAGYRWYSFFLNRRIYEHRKRGKKHELEHNLTLLNSLIPQLPENVRFEFEISPEMQEWRMQRLKEMNIAGDFIILHPGNGGSAPNLSVEQYRRIVRFFLENTAFSILITGAAQESELAAAIAGAFDSPRVIPAAGRFDIEQLMSLIGGAALFLSSSTGPLHIANALNVPVGGFYCPAGPCSPRRWGPYHQLEWVLLPPVTPCAECNIRKCPNGNCLEKVTDQQLNEFLVRRLKSFDRVPAPRQKTT